MNHNQLSILKNELKNDPTNLGYASLDQDYPAIAELLNHQEYVSNPDPAPKRLKAMTAVTFLALLSAAQRVTLYTIAGSAALIDSIKTACQPSEAGTASMEEKLLERTQMFSVAADILTLTAEQQALISPVISGQEDIPGWPTTVAQASRAETLGLDTVKDQDIQRVLHEK